MCFKYHVRASETRAAPPHGAHKPSRFASGVLYRVVSYDHRQRTPPHSAFLSSQTSVPASAFPHIFHRDLHGAQRRTTRSLAASTPDLLRHLPAPTAAMTTPTPVPPGSSGSGGATSTLLQFAPLPSIISPNFWHALTTLKLEHLRLDEAPLPLSGRYTLGRSVKDRTTGREVGVGGGLVLDEGSLQGVRGGGVGRGEGEGRGGGGLGVEARGELRNYNTAVQFTQADKNEIFNGLAAEVSGSATPAGYPVSGGSILTILPLRIHPAPTRIAADPGRDDDLPGPARGRDEIHGPGLLRPQEVQVLPLGGDSRARG